MSVGLVRGNSSLLFCKVDWYSVSRHQQKLIEDEIDAYHSEKLLNTSDDALEGYFLQKYRIDVPALNRDAIVVDQRETQIDVSRDPQRFIRDRSRSYFVSGTLVEVEVPFTGDEALFYVQPTSFTLNPPSGVVRGSSLFFSVQGTTLEASKVKSDIDRFLAEVEGNLNNLRPSAAGFNEAIPGGVQARVTARKQKLLADRNLVADLGYALKKRDGAATTYATSAVRKKITPTQPSASTSRYVPEPVLPDDEYNGILDVMTNMVSVMECSPSAFSTSDEEAIRTHFLVQLNGQYQGQASGETFNYEGKTDILIRDKGRCIFIAECKFWRGEKAFLATIDQLLGYLTWRDTKSAIIVFNRNKDFTSVLEKVSSATKGHPNFRKLVKQRSETSWIFKFAHRDDPNREMTIAVMVFEVPAA